MCFVYACLPSNLLPGTLACLHSCIAYLHARSSTSLNRRVRFENYQNNLKQNCLKMFEDVWLAGLMHQCTLWLLDSQPGSRQDLEIGVYDSRNFPKDLELASPQLWEDYHFACTLSYFSTQSFTKVILEVLETRSDHLYPSGRVPSDVTHTSLDVGLWLRASHREDRYQVPHPQLRLGRVRTRGDSSSRCMAVMKIWQI